MTSDALEQYKILHNDKSYGVTSGGFTPLISLFLLDLKPNRILDYGCGQSLLYQKIGQYGFSNYDRYDPAIDTISTIPHSEYDLIINTDVMEHIPKSEVDAVLSHMQSLTTAVFFNIAMYPAKTTLPSGENAHCTLENAEWWKSKISEYFTNAHLIYNREDRECGIITWKEKYPGVYRDTYLYLVENKNLKKTLAKKQPFYKKIPKKWVNSIKKRL